MRLLDSLLNRVTMYRLMVYFLVALVVWAALLSVWQILPYDPLSILVGAMVLPGLCYGANLIFARLFHVQANVESPIITGLILSLILGPGLLPANFLTYTLAAIAAMASKYLLVIQKRHIFNPAAFGVIITAVVLGQGASWWIGSQATLPVIVLLGLIVVYKIRRFNLIIAFLVTYLVLLFVQGLARGVAIEGAFAEVAHILRVSPIAFFVYVMLIEPLTSPADRRLRAYFGVFTALALFVYQSWLTGIPYTLELALLSGNIFARIVSADPRRVLTLRRKEEIAPTIWAFHFQPTAPIAYRAGQFLEWTLPHAHPDSRGTRRFFTIASSPTEDDILLVTKIPTEKGSSFKNALRHLRSGDTISAANLEGEFTLPASGNQGLVFIAGGIGVTPFRSMIQYSLNEKLHRPMTLMYSSRTADELVFQDLFARAEKELGLKSVYTITDDSKKAQTPSVSSEISDTVPPKALKADRNPERELGEFHIPKNWKGRTGFIDEKMIREEVPDYKDRVFYVSGPEPMVLAFEKMLKSMGVPTKNIKRDRFVGYTDTHQASAKAAVEPQAVSRRA